MSDQAWSLIYFLCNEITFKKKSSDKNHEALCVFINLLWRRAVWIQIFPPCDLTNERRALPNDKRKEIVRWGLALAEPKNHARNWAQSELFSQPPIGLAWAAETSGSVSVKFSWSAENKRSVLFLISEKQGVIHLVRQLVNLIRKGREI